MSPLPPPPPGAPPPAPYGPPPGTPFYDPPPPRYGPYELASWGYRAGAIGIDITIAVLLGVATWGLARALGAPGDRSLGFGLFGAVLTWPLVMAIPMAVRNGQSLGKMALSIYIVREDGRPAGFWWSMVRDTLCRGLFFFVPLGILVDYLIAAGQKHQTVHDRMTGTRVVRGSAYKSRVPLASIGTISGVLATLGVLIAIGAANDHGRHGGEYTVAERDLFVHGCSTGGADKARCGCLFDYLKVHMPYKDFIDFSKRYDANPDSTHLPQDFIDGADHCAGEPQGPTRDGA